MSTERVTELVKEIQSGVSQKSASQKDEVRVMKALLNDKEYVVDIYGKNGVEGTVCPSAEAREMVASVLVATAKISGAEAEKLAADHEFKTSEAKNMINVSKEFVNTYLGTGRKLPLGGREKSDASLILEQVEAGTKSYPKKTGVKEDGSAIWGTGESPVAAHEKVKSISSCPAWVK